MNIEKTKQLLMFEHNISKQTLQEMIEKEIADLSGLIDEEGALVIISRNLKPEKGMIRMSVKKTTQSTLLERYQKAMAKVEKNETFVNWNNIESGAEFIGRIVELFYDNYDNRCMKFASIDCENEEVVKSYKIPKALQTQLEKLHIEKQIIRIVYGGIKDYQGTKFHSFFVQNLEEE